MADAQHTVAVRLVQTDKDGQADVNANFTGPDRGKVLDRGIAWLQSQKEKPSGKGGKA